MTVWIVIAFLFSLALAVAHAGKQAVARLKKAQAEYESALAFLEEEPSDNSRRIKALEKGRAYADLARTQAGSKGRAIFDEVALSNDLNARGATGLAVGPGVAADEWACPECAEIVKQAARKCRFCGCVFSESVVGAR